ncbi:hypothetical protein [Ciceribacter ferrooxidans]|uniref:DUF1127 domain-containing protein n=1 Tax=Ciceribacter ferrooxidans TaxID=2509717 RepID=A0A4Q2TUL8_9HYPH|nr:hypothetical protein [Ciceribacter ferrooxidans]RYC23684.1 hypothetical protein EUU22_02935 [Ciceribacter ferrooxidans]
MRFTSLSQKIPDLGVTRALRKMAARNARRRSIRQMESLPRSLQKDVGWPDIARRAEADDQQLHQWM